MVLGKIYDKIIRQMRITLPRAAGRNRQPLLKTRKYPIVHYALNDRLCLQIHLHQSLPPGGRWIFSSDEEGRKKTDEERRNLSVRIGLIQMHNLSIPARIPHLPPSGHLPPGGRYGGRLVAAPTFIDDDSGR